MGTISFKVRLVERIVTWFTILLIPFLFACFVLFGLFYIQEPSKTGLLNLVGLSGAEIEQLFQYLWLVLISLGIIFGFISYIRFRGPLITQYCLLREGILFREFGACGMRTSLATSVQPWNEINGVRIIERGRIRLVFHAGDSLESKWPVADPWLNTKRINHEK